MTHASTPPNQQLAYLAAQSAMPVAAVLAVRVAVVLSKWATRRRTRLALRQLSVHQLRDVGITPADAHAEARRMFWQA